MSSSCRVNCDSEVGSGGGFAAAMFVRVVNDNAASTCNGDVDGTGVNGMKTPGGNPGDRRRMYQPRNGRCIVHRMVFVELCYILNLEPIFSKIYIRTRTYDEVLHDFFVVKESFLREPTSGYNG